MSFVIFGTNVETQNRVESQHTVLSCQQNLLKSNTITQLKIKDDKIMNSLSFCQLLFFSVSFMGDSGYSRAPRVQLCVQMYKAELQTVHKIAEQFHKLCTISTLPQFQFFQEPRCWLIFHYSAPMPNFKLFIFNRRRPGSVEVMSC